MRRPTLHKSTLVVAAIAAVAMGRIAIPGRERDQHVELIPSQYDGRVRFDHGWPFTYAERYVPFDAADRQSWQARWKYWQGESYGLMPAALLGDAGLAFALVVAAAAAWERRRRRRAHACQLTIAEMLLFVGAAATACGWLSHARQEWQSEQVHLRALSSANAPYAEEFGARFTPWMTPWAPDWLVRLVGPDWLPECLERCTMMHVIYDSDQAYDGFADAAAHLQPLEHLRVMTITAPSRRHVIPFDDLAELPQLRVLDLGSYLSRDEVESWQILPDELERLRTLDRLVLPTRANLGLEAERVLRARMPRCRILFADE